MAKKTIKDIESKTPRYRELFLLEKLDELVKEVKGLRKDLKKDKEK